MKVSLTSKKPIGERIRSPVVFLVWRVWNTYFMSISSSSGVMVSMSFLYGSSCFRGITLDETTVEKYASTPVFLRAPLIGTEVLIVMVASSWSVLVWAMMITGFANLGTSSCMRRLKVCWYSPQAARVSAAVRTYWVSSMSIQNVILSRMIPFTDGSSLMANSKASMTS